MRLLKLGFSPSLCLDFQVEIWQLRAQYLEQDLSRPKKRVRSLEFQVYQLPGSLEEGGNLAVSEAQIVPGALLTIFTEFFSPQFHDGNRRFVLFRGCNHLHVDQMQ